MTTQEKLIHRKLSLLDLAEYLKNVSEACRVMGVSRQHFYDIKQAFEEGGIEALREKNRCKPNLRNRAPAHVEKAVCEFAVEQPAYGQVRTANELRKRGIEISGAGVRCIWLRYDLETRGKRLKALEAKAAAEGWVYTEAQLVALERAKQERENDPESIETEHPGYLLAQDTMYVGHLKGVGRIYQQTALDTFSSVGFAKLYTTKAPVTAAFTQTSTLRTHTLPAAPLSMPAAVQVAIVLSHRCASSRLSSAPSSASTLSRPSRRRAFALPPSRPISRARPVVSCGTTTPPLRQPDAGGLLPGL
jgi:hypothetical protein